MSHNIAKSSVGLYAEQVAEQYLSGKGYEVLDRNWRRPWGELDLVAYKDGVVVVVEVKANSMAGSHFDPEVRADWHKIQKVVRTARTWLVYRKYPDDQEWQVDVVSVIFDRINKNAKIRHFKNIDL